MAEKTFRMLPSSRPGVFPKTGFSVFFLCFQVKGHVCLACSLSSSCDDGHFDRLSNPRGGKPLGTPVRDDVD